MKKTLIFTAVIFIVSACSKNEVYEANIGTTNVEKCIVTPQQAKLNTLDFIKNINSTCSRASQHIPEIAEVKAITTTKLCKKKGMPIKSGIDTLFYVVNFVGRDNGFALASANVNDEPIYAYVENGSYEDLTSDINTETKTTSKPNPGFKRFLAALYERTLTNMEDSVDSAEYNFQEEIIKVKPKIYTRWDQTAPYNKYCFESYAGCVPIAIAQILTFAEPLSSIQWPILKGYSPKTLHWDAIREDSKAHYGHPRVYTEEVAQLVHYLGVIFDAKYSEKGTEVNSEKALKNLRSFGINVSGLNEYSGFNVMCELTKGNVIFMRGNARYYHVGFVFRKYVEGHAWVIDGYINHKYKYVDHVYFHCNWGWGGDRNGYFSEQVFNADNNPIYPDDALTRSHYYRYNLEYAVFSKK